MKQPPFLNQSQQLAQDCSTFLAHVTPGSKIYPRQRHPSFAGKRFLPPQLFVYNFRFQSPVASPMSYAVFSLRETKHGLNILVVKVNIDQGYLENHIVLWLLFRCWVYPYEMVISRLSRCIISPSCSLVVLGEPFRVF